MSHFAKTPACPTSYDLAERAAGELDEFLRSLIDRHVAACDFCAAETELYRRFPLTKYEPVTAPSIPEPLYDLAFNLLNSRI